MKRAFILLIILLCTNTGHCFYGVHAIGSSGIFSGGEPPAEYLFQADFETDGMITWDSTPAAEDCDGYDYMRDWCDYDTSQYHGGGHSLGILGGASNAYLTKNLAGSASEFYIDGWIRFDNLANNLSLFRIEHSDTTMDISFLILNTGTFYISHGGGTNQSATGLASVDTWHHIGIYYKQESTTGSSGDGIVRVYLRTDDLAFTYTDVVIENTSVATGTVDADVLFLRGTAVGTMHWYDDVEVMEGDPEWPDS